MGDARHKGPYPTGVEREITDEWRERVRAQLAANRVLNKNSGRRRDPDRPPDDHASLARAIGADKTGIANLIGPVRPTSRANPRPLSSTSAYHDEIVRVLGVPPSTKPVDPDDELAPQLEHLNDEERDTLARLLTSPKRSQILRTLRTLIETLEA